MFNTRMQFGSRLARCAALVVLMTVAQLNASEGLDDAGPCCVFGGCLEVDAEECITLGGVPGEAGDRCLCVACYGPIGVCCLVPEGCLPDMTRFECETSGGFFHPGAICETHPCALDHGACCLPDDTCIETDPFLCEDKLNGVFLGKFSLCDDGVCGEPCDADLDDDGVVGAADLLELLGQWGTLDCGPPDFAGDGVGIDDLILMLSLWGPCP